METNVTRITRTRPSLVAPIMPPYDICRFCSSGKGTISVYNKRQFNIIKAAKVFSGVRVVREDPYSKWICKKCFSLLKGAVVFRTRAQETHRQLRDQLQLNQGVVNILDNYFIEPEDNVSEECDFETLEENTLSATVDNILEKYKVADMDHDSFTKPRSSFEALRKNHSLGVKSNRELENDDIPLSVQIFNNSLAKKPKANRVTCDMCMKVVNKRCFNGHMASHNGKRLADGRIQCRICNKILLHNSFKKHILLFHNDSAPELVCEHCGKSFKYVASYSLHMANHTSDYRYKCEHCDYRGATESYLKQHMRRHMTKEYQCDICAMKCSLKNNLIKHIQRHDGKKFNCSECNRTFYTKTEAEQHYEVDHLGIKKFYCQICNKYFGYRSALMKHQRGVHKRPALGNGPTPSYLKPELIVTT